MNKQQVLVDWLDGEFREALLNDASRIEDSLWTIKVAVENGDSSHDVMRLAIASFVQGLILGERPIAADNK